MAAKYLAILFDIDGTLINSGGAGAASWRLAFDELYGIPADIGKYTDTGMTDPDVGRQTFEALLHREPTRGEFAKLLERRLHYLYQPVAGSKGYRVLEGATDLLAQLLDDGYLLGIVSHAREVPGWENLVGFFRHMRFIRNRQQKVTRVALATESTLAGLAPRIAEHFVKAELKAFPYDALESAIAWAQASAE